MTPAQTKVWKQVIKPYGRPAASRGRRQGQHRLHEGDGRRGAARPGHLGRLPVAPDATRAAADAPGSGGAGRAPGPSATSGAAITRARRARHDLPGAARWFAGLAVAATLAVVALVAVGRRRHEYDPAAVAVADADEPSAPYQQRRRFPNVVQDAPRRRTPGGALGGAGARARPARAAAAPESPTTNRRPRPRRGEQWITGYRDAVCSCKTRSCVVNLQARFLNTLATTSYDRERDDARYVAESRGSNRLLRRTPRELLNALLPARRRRNRQCMPGRVDA